MSNFTRNDKADTNGTSLQEYLDGVKRPLLIKLFGDPNNNGYWDDEKGYDGEGWTFTEDGTEGTVVTPFIGPELQGPYVVHVYARFGSYRVGAHDSDAAKRFVTWLKSKA